MKIFSITKVKLCVCVCVCVCSEYSAMHTQFPVRVSQLMYAYNYRRLNKVLSFFSNHLLWLYFILVVFAFMLVLVMNTWG